MSAILTLCFSVLLYSCAGPVNDGVLIIPSSGNPAPTGAAVSAESEETAVPYAETAEAAVTQTAAAQSTDGTEAMSDALIQAEQLFRDDAFLELLAQYEQSADDPQTALAAAVLAYQHRQGDHALPGPADDGEDTVVYWTAGGSVWHVTAECSALAKSKSIESGSMTQAKQAGKTRVCKRCGA